jgi:16S rRNA (cytidine1402-2'-O)-methyltransferase
VFKRRRSLSTGHSVPASSGAFGRSLPIRRDRGEEVRGSIRDVSGTLFVVGTPIGNLGDLTERARETLAAVDLVAAEDTRRTGHLLRSIGVRSPMRSFHDANEAERTQELVRFVLEGHDVALVSDGGMPLVSDPGFRLVRAAADAGIEIVAVPGPSAAVAALAVSGLPTDRWAFEGFLPKKEGERARRLESVRGDPRTLILFESPLRVRALLEELRGTLGDRRIALCRELTKLHEETIRGTISEVLVAVGDRSLKGEVVLVLAGAGDAPSGDLVAATDEARSLVAGGMRPREAAKQAAFLHGISANEIYRSLTSS